jgi:hypothetical protein
MQSKREVASRFAAAMNELADESIPFAEILCEALEMHIRKSNDYGDCVTKDPYANVRASEDFGVPAWKGSLIRAHDKITRLKQFARKGALANESAADSMLDLCVYFPIILMLYRQASEP